MSQSASFSSDHIPDISDFYPEKWTIKFVNEGAANLVFEVRLPPSPPSTTGSHANGHSDIFQGTAKASSFFCATASSYLTFSQDTSCASQKLAPRHFRTQSYCSIGIQPSRPYSHPKIWSNIN